MKNPRVLIALLLLLAGCAGGAKHPEPARYDLGSASRAPLASKLPLRSLAVSAPSWLDGNAIQYRLAYVQPARRQSYAESRWAAPPGALLEQLLRQRLQTGAPDGACRLALDLDEFVQDFVSVTASLGRIEVRAQLIAARGDAVLARQSFIASEAASSPDAVGGVAAHGVASGVLAEQLAAWLNGLDTSIIGACRSKAGA